MRKLSAWTWFNWNFKYPANFGDVANANGNCYNIIRLNYQRSRGVRADLCFDENGAARVNFEDYVGAGDGPSGSHDLPSEDDLDEWNFVYLHHDDDTGRSIGFIKWGATG